MPKLKLVLLKIILFADENDGYVIMRGCSTKNICSILQQNATALDNNAIAIPTECQTCNEDFCDPQQSSGETNSYLSNFENLFFFNFCIEVLGIRSLMQVQPIILSHSL